MRRVWLLLALGVVGCKDVRVDSGADAAFLHPPATLYAPLPSPTKPLFPPRVGSRWTFQLTGGEQGIEEQVLTQVRPDGTVVIEGRRQGHPLHVELYQVTTAGIFQVGAGGKERLTMNPPIPLLRRSLSVEEMIEWQGGIEIPTGTVLGRAWSLVRGIETITVPAGEFTAYRTDTTLEANISGKLALFLTSRWFVPGVGIVKTRYVVREGGQGEQRFARELVRFTPPARG